jgi:hypothetical protein
MFHNHSNMTEFYSVTCDFSASYKAPCRREKTTLLKNVGVTYNSETKRSKTTYAV